MLPLLYSGGHQDQVCVEVENPVFSLIVEILRCVLGNSLGELPAKKMVQQERYQQQSGEGIFQK